MKTTLTKILSIATAMLCFNTMYGQFNTGGSLTDRWAQTNDPFGLNNDIRRGGMGNFANFGTAPGAAFHINENYLTDLIPIAINYYLPGEVFRTTGPSTNVNAWRMFTGAGNGTERFSITIPANTDEAILQTVQNGAMRFNTNSTQRMLLTASGEVIINSLACADCLVMTKKNGELYTDNQILKNLEDKIKFLEQKLVELESLFVEKLMCLND